ncbi:MAG TPA: hypothetical protein VMV02_04100 [Acidimicrobiales bacterium]|nr:hypothetical protein [Acidimicrobiales bacterium]
MAPDEEPGYEERWSSDAELPDDILRLLVSELDASHGADRHEARA